MTSTEANTLMVSEAKLALDAYGKGEMALYDLHRLNARRIADGLDLGVQHKESEGAEA